jgi:hypothetical protein
MVALSASRLVWPAISLISLTTSPICCAAWARPSMRSLPRRLSSTAWFVTTAALSIWRRISPIELSISSDAAATVERLPAEVSLVVRISVSWPRVLSAVPIIDCEALFICTAAATACAARRRPSC